MPEKYAFVPGTVLPLWQGHLDSIQFVRESANIVFRFETAGGHGRYLRITRVWQREKVVSAMDYLRFLVERGAPVYRPFPSVQGRIIDFDEPMRGWFAADVARPFREIADFPLALRQQLMRAFISGYREIRPFNEQSAAALPWFLRLKNLSIYAWELEDNDGQVDDPEMIALRREIINPTLW